MKISLGNLGGPQETSGSDGRKKPPEDIKGIETP